MLPGYNVMMMEGSYVFERIVSMLKQIEDENLLERIYWFVERLLVQKPPRI